jgi:hypothetical protein
MGDFVARLLNLDHAEAKRRQKEMFYKHGPTLRGLMTEHGITPDAFLDYVHDIDHSPVPLNRKLARQLLAPGWTCRIDKAKRLLGYSPKRTIRDSLIRSGESYVKLGWL